MRKEILSLGAIFGIILIMPFASGQLFEKATFQESALVIYDQQYSNSVITSIGLETISNQEIKFTDELIKKINDNEKIRAIVFTNAGECVIGVTSEEQCIMINFFLLLLFFFQILKIIFFDFLIVLMSDKPVDKIIGLLNFAI